MIQIENSMAFTPIRFLILLGITTDDCVLKLVIFSTLLVPEPNNKSRVLHVPALLYVQHRQQAVRGPHFRQQQSEFRAACFTTVINLYFRLRCFRQR
ncbi:hypothetical protein SLA2020_176720 [Shorea laevis]